MRIGEAIKETARLIRENPVPTTIYSVPSSIIGDCCYKHNVLAENPVSEYNDPLRNDKSFWPWFFNEAFESAEMKLEKYVNGDWEEVKDLDNNDFGTYYAYGFFTNGLGEKCMAYRIDWQKVLVHVDLGEGKYRIKATGDGTISGEVTAYSWEYCLLTWTADRENGTIKLEWYANGRMGDPKDDTKQRDFATQNLYNQIRLQGDFGRPSSPFESEHVHYQSGAKGKGKEVWLQNKFKDEYLLTLYPIPHYVHEFLKHNFMLGDDPCISDFNTRNPVHLIQKFVKPVANWEPNWNFGNKLASVELKFENLYQNAQHKRC